MELLQAYNSYYAVKKDYCVICLRSSDDRRMVKIRSLENFIRSVNLPFSYIEEKICYVCERQAMAAHRFRLAVNLSASVHNLFLMMHSSRTRLDVIRQLNGQKPMTGVLRNVPEWEQRLTSVRRNSQLLQTEVLCVDSLVPGSGPGGKEIQTGQDSSPQGPGAGGDEGEADVYVIPDAAPPVPRGGGGVDPRKRDRVHDVRYPKDGTMARKPGSDDGSPKESRGTFTFYRLSEPEIYMESVVILDEEEDPINIKTEDQMNEITLDNSDLNVSTHTTPANVPMEALLDEQSTSQMALIQDTMTGLQTSPTNSTNFLLHPIVEKNGIITVPSLAAQIINGQLVTMDSSNIIIQTPKLALQNGLNFDLLTDPSQVANVLKSVSNSNAESYSVISDVLPMKVLQNNVMQSVDFVQNGASGNSLPNVQNFGTIANVQNEVDFGHVPKISNVTGNVQNDGRKQKRNSSNNTQTNIMNTPSSGQTDLMNPILSAQLLSGGNLVLSAEVTPQFGTLVKALPGFTSGQIYKKSIQHINIASTDEPTVIIEDEENRIDEQSRKETGQFGGKRRQSEMENSKRSRIEEEGKQIEKTAQRETDWEDKIPMDVISFMDATDPNAASVLNPQPATPKPPEPPLGVISNVHTVQEGENVHSEENNSPKDTSKSIGETETSLRPNQTLGKDSVTKRGTMLWESGISMMLNRNLTKTVGNTPKARRGRPVRQIDKRTNNSGGNSGDVIDLC